ncbi:hypothetical protein BKA18_005533 [Streptomyces auratus]
MDLRPQRAEEGHDSVRGAKTEGGTGGDGGALLAVRLGLVAAGVMAPGPYAERDGEGADYGDDAEEVDAVDDGLQDGEAGQATALRCDARVVGEVDDPAVYE